MRRPPTPSRVAASVMSSGMALMAADRIVMANPAWIQIITTISSRLFQNGMSSRFTGSNPSHTSSWLTNPICWMFCWLGRYS